MPKIFPIVKDALRYRKRMYDGKTHETRERNKRLFHLTLLAMTAEASRQLWAEIEKVNKP